MPVTTLTAPDTVLSALLDQVAQHDEGALRALYDLSASKLLGLAFKIVRNQEWAEDVLQEAYLSIWSTAHNYRAALSPPMAWMGLVVRSRALDFLRRRQAAGISQQTELDEILNNAIASDAPSPLEQALMSEQAFGLAQCLSRLEPRQREAVNLAYLRDLSHSELAAQMNLPLGTVKTWIRRGLDQLRVCMARFA